MIKETVKKKTQRRPKMVRFDLHSKTNIAFARRHIENNDGFRGSRYNTQ